MIPATHAYCRLPIRTGVVGIWCWCRADEHHNTSVLVGLSCSRLAHIHADRSSTQTDTRSRRTSTSAGLQEPYICVSSAYTWGCRWWTYFWLVLYTNTAQYSHHPPVSHDWTQQNYNEITCSNTSVKCWNKRNFADVDETNTKHGNTDNNVPVIPFQMNLDPKLWAIQKMMGRLFRHFSPCESHQFPPRLHHLRPATMQQNNW